LTAHADDSDDEEDLLPPVAEQFVKDCAAALKACPPGKAAIYLGGEALLDTSPAGVCMFVAATM
jgi:hypothetical protein